MANKAACNKCGKVYTRIDQLIDVHAIGLALAATCPACGGRVWANDLWICTQRLTGKQEVKRPGARAGDSRKV
jgi:hypothetical protein